MIYSQGASTDKGRQKARVPGLYTGKGHIQASIALKDKGSIQAMGPYRRGLYRQRVLTEYRQGL